MAFYEWVEKYIRLEAVYFASELGQLVCSIKGRPARMANVRMRGEKCEFHTLSPHKSFLYFLCIQRSLCFIPHTSISAGSMQVSQWPLADWCVLLILDAFIRTLLSLVLIRNLGMKSDYALFRNSCSSNVCPLGSQTYCRSMKNPMKQLGPPFEDFSFSCKNPGLSQQERWLWENKEMAKASKWQMLFQSICQSKWLFQSYTFLYYCPLLHINTIWWWFLILF